MNAAGLQPMPRVRRSGALVAVCVLWVAGGGSAAATPVRAHMAVAASPYVGGHLVDMLVPKGFRATAPVSGVGPRTGSGVGIDTATGASIHLPEVSGGQVGRVVADGAGGWYISAGYGGFTHVGGLARSVAHILADGTVDPGWNPNPSGGVVTSLAVLGSAVYAAGTFTSIGGQSRAGLAALDAATGTATAWNPNPTGYTGALAAAGSTVYAGGNFTSIGGQSRAGLAALDATTGTATAWNPNPASVKGAGFVSALAVWGSTVYVGGNFTSIGGQSRAGLAALDAATGSATAWNANPGRSAPITVLTASGSTVYVAGNFTSIGGQSRAGLAALDPATGAATSWNPRPGGSVATLAASGSTVYVGGSFSSIGGQSRKNLAALDASTGNATAWTSDADSWVNTVAVSGTTLYVGGNFTSIGGQPGTGGAPATVRLKLRWYKYGRPRPHSRSGQPAKGALDGEGVGQCTYGPDPRTRSLQRAWQCAADTAFPKGHLRTVWFESPGARVISRVCPSSTGRYKKVVGGFLTLYQLRRGDYSHWSMPGRGSLTPSNKAWDEALRDACAKVVAALR